MLLFVYQPLLHASLPCFKDFAWHEGNRQTMGLDVSTPFLTNDSRILFHCVYILCIFLYRKARPTMSACRSTMSPSPGNHTGNFLYFVLCVFISSQVKLLTSAINARSFASPIPYRVYKFSIFGEVFGEGGIGCS